MKISRILVLASLAFWIAAGGGVFACGNSSSHCPQGEDCTKDCINQADCSDNQTCLNSGVCACFAGQNGAQCSDISDCAPDETCSVDCQCLPAVSDSDAES